MKHKCALFVAILSFWLAGALRSAYAQSDALDAYLEERSAAHRVPSLALAIAYADGRVDVRTYGEGIAPTTRFRIGSLSKSMTAVAVMQLFEEGRLDLDAPIQTYLTDFTTQNPDWARRITVRHLLNQTSGLSDRDYAITVNARPLEALPSSFARARHTAEPSAQFAYFNANYDLLGRIVEVVSGQTYSAYLSQRLFAPARMQTALAYDDPTPRAIEGLAQGHILLYGFPIPYAEQLPIPAPSGGIIASGADMAAFLRQFVIEEPSILSPDGITTVLSVPNGIDSSYAMGWFAAPNDDGRRIFNHAGDVLTFHADMVLLPDDGIAFALLYNRQSLLLGFATYPEIREGVIALLRGGKPAQSGISASVIGIIILSVSIAVVVNDSLRLLLSRRWVNSRQNILKRGMRVIALLIPVAILLLLPTLILSLTGRGVNYAVLIAYLPDIMLLLVVSAALNCLTLIAYLLIGLQESMRKAQP